LKIEAKIIYPFLLSISKSPGQWAVFRNFSDVHSEESISFISVSTPAILTDF
jgi:hypothetical protein